MSSKICKGCGGLTNTVFCDWVEYDDFEPRKCMLRYVDGKWEKGCGYNQGNHHFKKEADDILKSQEKKK